jgi:ABC-2 type transport system permease protein
MTMKFGNLLKKELRELITKQVIISMVFTLFIFIFMGRIMSGAIDDSIEASSSITLCDKDKTDFTAEIISNIKEDGHVNIKTVDIKSDDYAVELERLDIKNVVIIPEGFTDSILVKKEPAPLKFISEIKTGGLSSSMSTISSSDAVSSIQKQATDAILLKSYGITDKEIERIQAPVNVIEYSVADGKSAMISASDLSGIMMGQSMIAPFVIFFLLLMASQMIMTAISTEKIDKTLETLLSAPVSRLSVLTAKMIAALIVALINAAVMMIGFVFYISGMTGGMTDEISSSMTTSASMGTSVDIGQAMSDLGMMLSVSDYVVFGLQLFFTVAIGLSIALMLGAMATDVKSVQSLVMPIMILVMVPFFVTMFADISTMSVPFKVLLYAIPFTHSFTALTNMMNGNNTAVLGGLVYQIVFFIVCMFLAVRMFTTDKLFTVSLNLGKKMKNKNHADQEA